MTPKEYTVAGIVIDGVRNLDHNLIIQKSKLKRGARINIPGEEIEVDFFSDFTQLKFVKIVSYQKEEN